MGKVYFIGPAGGEKELKNGASAKNFYMLAELRRKGVDVTVLDSENWKRDPKLLLRILMTFAMHRNATFIVGANNASSDKIIRLSRLLGVKRVVYSVIGGSLGRRMKVGEFKPSNYRNVSHFLVEGYGMKRELEELGLGRVMRVPNFKPVPYLPEKPERTPGKTRFTFLSRIIPEKGVETIFEAMALLNSEVGMETRFDVSFYGPVDESYRTAFDAALERTPNARYLGFLDLKQYDNYDELARYDAMLFPTYWRGEGFPGIIIDAYIAGLPVIASRHSMNAEIVEDGRTGLLVEKKDAKALADAMRRMIDGETDLDAMTRHCREKVAEYSVDKVLNRELLQETGLL